MGCTCRENDRIKELEAQLAEAQCRIERLVRLLAGRNKRIREMEGELLGLSHIYQPDMDAEEVQVYVAGIASKALKGTK